MLFKRTHKKPIPEGATVTRTRAGKVAKWTDPRGRKQTAAVSEDGNHILLEAATWTARYRNSEGKVIQRPTGCEKLEYAQTKLSDWLGLEEKRKAGIVSGREATAAEWAYVSMTDHVNAFKATMTAKGLHKETVRMRTYYLTRIFKACKVSGFTDVSKTRLERWLMDQIKGGMGLRTANGHISALVAFGNWAVREGRVSVTPFSGMAKFNEKTDQRRPRRAFKPEELNKLFQAAQERPLHELKNKNTRAKDKGKQKPAELSPETIDAAQWLGRVRSLAYKTMANTGLRFGELRSLTLGQVHLDQTPAYVELKPEHEKARRGARLPLPAFLVGDLKQYLTDRKKRLLGHSSEFPGALKDKPLFDLPKKMTKVFNRDLVYAGLAVIEETKDKKRRVNKKNEHGQSLDIHCLRHSFISNLALSGASMVTVAKAARHSDPRLTLKVYSHVGLEELGNAVDLLPAPGPCIKKQVMNDIPRGGINSLSLKTSLGDGILSHIEAHNGTFEGEGQSGENDRKPLKTLVNTGVLNGGRCRTRTCDPLRVRQGGTAQKSPQTLGETDPAENVVTQNVTQNTKNVTREALLEALRGIPRGDLLGLLSDLLKDR